MLALTKKQVKIEAEVVYFHPVDTTIDPRIG
jgi:hypothetical protein